MLGRAGVVGPIPLGQPGYWGFNCAAFDPKTPRTVWIGSTHGVFKSEDGGLSRKAGLPASPFRTGKPALLNPLFQEPPLAFADLHPDRFHAVL